METVVYRLRGGLCQKLVKDTIWPSREKAQRYIRIVHQTHPEFLYLSQYLSPKESEEFLELFSFGKEYSRDRSHFLQESLPKP